MKQLYLLILAVLFYGTLPAQMDTEHWFAPFADATGGNRAMQSLYLSTNRTTPFTVTIYNNNLPVNTVTISKGNPGVVQVSRDMLISTRSLQSQTKSTMGLHLVGDYKFYATLRFSVSSHAEIVTSKGKASLGNEFFVYTPRNQVGDYYFNSTFGFTATEDFTTVTVSNFKDNTMLSNGTVVGATTVHTVTLNKGESYIYETISDQSVSDLSGVNVKSDKPITLTNGDFNMVSPNLSNNDIFMDQSIPVDRLGTEYILMKGNGNLNTQMEQGIVVATQDNTNVYVNGSTTPINIAKKGQYVYIESSNYVLANAASDAYNMYIRTDKNAYVYQLLAGVDEGSSAANSYASGGMNLIPPLACLLPQTIDELPYVDSVPYSSSIAFNTRINIITQKGSTVKLNGTTLSGNYGPFDVPGNNTWETYTYPQATGNIKIESTNAVTAGIAGGNMAVGYGGYFAGFNSIPVVSKGGDCDKENLTLEVDDTYDSYQWYKNGQPYTGTGANTYKIAPDGAGSYYVKIIKNNCGTMDSPVYMLQPCPIKTVLNVDTGKCAPLKVMPKFAASQQAVDPKSVIIVTRPANGTIAVDQNTGEITYTLTNTSATSDTFSFKFQGISTTFPDVEVITVNITLKDFDVYNGSAKACVNNGVGLFNLDDVKLSDTTGLTYTYYKTNAAAQTADASQQITAFHPYAGPAGTVYARVINSVGCFKIAEITLIDTQPNINTNVYNSTICDDDLDGSIAVKFSDITQKIVKNYTDFTVEYFDNANYAGNPLPDAWNFTQDTDVYVCVYSAAACTVARDVIRFKFGNKIPVSAASISQTVCDTNRDATETVNLNDYKALINSDVNVQIAFFNSMSEAKLNTNPLSQTSFALTGPKTYYARLSGAGACANVAQISLNLNTPPLSSTLADKEICPGTTTLLDAGSGFDAYKWSTGATTPSITAGMGSYWVDLTTNGCTIRQELKVTEAAVPVITSIVVDKRTAVINASGGQPPYQYSLDMNTWQDENRFENLAYGLHKVYVKDLTACDAAEGEFLILNLVNTITPNGDGINDVLNYSDLSIKKDVKIVIFDRYGRSVFKGENSPFIWDGTQSGRKVSTGTYWYILSWTEPDTGASKLFRSWVMVKER